MRILFRNVNIFDGTGSPSRPGAVLVDGARIAAVAYGPGALTNERADRMIDGGGATLMPGMVEAHAHLSWGSSIEHVYSEFMLPPDEMKTATWRNARVLLDHGFTSAYSAGALADGLETVLKAEIDAGLTPGPRLLPSTIERSPEGDDIDDIFHGRGPESMRAFVAHCKADGVKIIKLFISGENALKPGSAADILYTEEEMDAVASAARDAGLWLSAHAYAPQAIAMAMRHGVRVIYHCTWADAASLDLLIAAKDDIFYAPAVGFHIATLEASPTPHDDMSEMKRNAQEVIELERVLVPELKRRGVRVLIGGDYGFPFNPNGRNARDLEHFVDLFGYTPREALSAATMLGGQLMGMGDDLGLIREGWLADLLLVDGDPTADVAIMQDKTRLSAIMRNGMFHKAPAFAAANSMA